MPISPFWRTSRFRQTLVYGAVATALLAGLLGLIYAQTAGYLGREADKILRVEAAALEKVPASNLPGRVDQAVRNDPRHIEIYGLFSRDGVRIAGNAPGLARLPPDGSPRELGTLEGYPETARVMAVRLPWGEVLVVGRLASQLAEVRRIILAALLWSGGLVVAVGFAVGAALSVQPLRRIEAVRMASERVAKGDLAHRLPIAGRHDEIDMLAGVVNQMMDELERLAKEARSVGDVVAHDLRTPLTRLRLLLSRLRQTSELAPAHAPTLDEAIAETDALLGRFKAILRISEFENQSRRAGFRQVDLLTLLGQAADLYRPLAAEKGLALETVAHGSAGVLADPDLLLEALANLIDNAIKFTPAGGAIYLALALAQEGPELVVIDNGPGVPPEERSAVTGRFYRSRRDQARPGAGLGLSIVAAIAHLHGFALVLEDAEPGLRAAIQCWPRALATGGD
jgi:signal transduction histidine kinase